VSDTRERYARHVDPAFVRLLGVLGYGRVFTRAEGVFVWDEEGRRYLDLLAGFGSVNVGHNHPRLLARLHAFLDEHALNLSHTGPSPQTAMLAEAMARCAGSPLEMALFSNSGAEAVEAAVKLARAATKRLRIVYCHGAYHGLSLGTLSLSSSERMRAPFEPLLSHCTAIPFDDVDALQRELTKGDVALFLVEPIQIEGGVRIASPGYLRDARASCAKHGALFALDEAQTGFGRTGSLFAFQAEGVAPDLLILAKAAGGSIAPIGITMTTRALQKKAYGSMQRTDLHGSTFAGNAFACVAASETLRILEDEQLVANSRDRGAAFLAALRERLRGHPRVREIRGRGLLIAIELTAPIDAIARTLLGQWAAVALLERGVLLQPASQAWNVLRIEPPLTIDSTHIDEAVGAIGAVFDEQRALPPLLAKATRRMAEQFVRKGTFR
jgi:putrescine aminotransferase